MGKQDLAHFHAQVDKAKIVAVDSSVFIYYFENNPLFADACDDLLRALEQKKIKVVTSVITHTEVLTGARLVGDTVLARKYHEFLTTTPNLALVPYTLNVSDLAAAMRARYRKLKLPDAVQLATAMISGADLLVTNDEDFKRAEKFVKIILLGDFAPNA